MVDINPHPSVSGVYTEIHFGESGQATVPFLLSADQPRQPTDFEVLAHAGCQLRAAGPAALLHGAGSLHLAEDAKALVWVPSKSDWSPNKRTMPNAAV